MPSCAAASIRSRLDPPPGTPKIRFTPRDESVAAIAPASAGLSFVEFALN
jgi:hypothetical protein